MDAAPDPAPSRRALLGLDALNFTLADVRDGLGPYLAIYLIAVRGPDAGWNEETTGLVMTIAGIAGLVAQTPAGVLIDRSHQKRALIVASAVAVTLSCLLLPWISDFYLVTATQSLAHIAAAVFPPAIAAITLGVVGPHAFAKRIGRNEGFNHAGNAIAAAIAGATAYRFGPIVVFWLMAALAGLSIAATLLIPAGEIDDDMARGLDRTPSGETGEHPSGFAVLAGNKTLLLFAVLCATFHLANAAMLTSVGQLLTRLSGKEHATSLIAICIVAAQCVMVPMAVLVGRNADRVGRKPIFLFAFGVLAVRGVLYTFWNQPFYLMAVQCLDGVGAGIYGALFPLVVADLTRGSGRFNAAQGAVATAQGLGAALSATIAGIIIVYAGYSAAFLTLAGIAAAGCLLFAFAMPETRRATPGGAESPDRGLAAPAE